MNTEKKKNELLLLYNAHDIDIPIFIVITNTCFLFILQTKGKSDNYWIVSVHENPQQLR